MKPRTLLIAALLLGLLCVASVGCSTPRPTLVEHEMIGEHTVEYVWKPHLSNRNLSRPLSGALLNKGNPNTGEGETYYDLIMELCDIQDDTPQTCRRFVLAEVVDRSPDQNMKGQYAVGALHWDDSNTFYIGYAFEKQPMIKRCNVTEENRLECSDQERASRRLRTSSPAEKSPDNEKQDSKPENKSGSEESRK